MHTKFSHHGKRFVFNLRYTPSEGIFDTLRSASF